MIKDNYLYRIRHPEKFEEINNNWKKKNKLKVKGYKLNYIRKNRLLHNAKGRVWSMYNNVLIPNIDTVIRNEKELLRLLKIE